MDLYDEDNPDGPDHDFYRSLAREVSADSILDLGCGTGILTVTLASGTRQVVGVDPSEAMLSSARRRPGGSAVDWGLGDSRSIPRGGFDYAVMTGNVSQHIPDDQWERTLADLHRALRTGGLLAFESRNPARREWEDWGSAARATRDTPHGGLTEWQDVREIAPGTVEATFHNLFTATGGTVTETLELAFRHHTTIEQQLDTAGFDVGTTFGGWDRQPLAEDSPVMIFTATAR